MKKKQILLGFLDDRNHDTRKFDMEITQEGKVLSFQISIYFVALIYIYTHPYNKLLGKLCSMSIITIKIFRKTPLSFLLVYQTLSKSLWYNWLVAQFFIIIKM